MSPHVSISPDRLPALPKCTELLPHPVAVIRHGFGEVSDRFRQKLAVLRTESLSNLTSAKRSRTKPLRSNEVIVVQCRPQLVQLSDEKAEIHLCSSLSQTTGRFGPSFEKTLCNAHHTTNLIRILLSFRSN